MIQLKGRNPQWESLMVPTAELPQGQKAHKSSKQSSCKFSFQAQMSPPPSSEELAASCLLPMSISCPFLCVMLLSVSDCPESLLSFSRTSFSPLGSSLVWEDKRGSRKPPPEGTASGKIWVSASFLISNFLVYIKKKQTNKILWCPVSSLVFPDKRRPLRRIVCLKEGQYVRNDKDNMVLCCNQTEPNKIYL